MRKFCFGDFETNAVNGFHIVTVASRYIFCHLFVLVYLVPDI